MQVLRDQLEAPVLMVMMGHKVHPDLPDLQVVQVLKEIRVIKVALALKVPKGILVVQDPPVRQDQQDLLAHRGQMEMTVQMVHRDHPVHRVQQDLRDQQDLQDQKEIQVKQVMMVLRVEQDHKV